MTLRSRYNEWKALHFLKEHGEYERYINGKIVALNSKGFKYFPKEICYLKELKALDLHNNKISHIPKEISFLKNNLENLIIKNNPLEQQTKEDIQELLPNTNIY